MADLHTPQPHSSHAARQMSRGLRPKRSRVRSPGAVHTILRAAIRSGVLADDARIVEEQIVQSLRVSRGSVREALSMLTREGLVSRGARVGTAVTGAITSVDLTSGRVVIDICSDSEYQALHLGSTVVSTSSGLLGPVDPTVTELHLTEWLVRRNSDPYCLYSIYSVKPVQPDTQFEWDARSDTDELELANFRRRYREAYGVDFAKITVSVEALLPDGRSAKLLDIPKDQPVLMCERLKLGVDGICRELSRTIYAGSAVALTADFDAR